MEKTSKKFMVIALVVLVLLTGCTMERMNTSKIQLKISTDTKLGIMKTPTLVCIPMSIQMLAQSYTMKPMLTQVPTPIPMLTLVPTPVPTAMPTPIPDKYATIASIGDIMCHEANYKAAYDAITDTYDFSSYFTYVSKYLLQADIAIGNLETTFAGEKRGYSGYPTFNSPDALGQAIKDIGVDILGTSNNHSLDKGYQGLERTLNVLDELGIEHMGTARSADEQNSVLIKDVNGIKIAFLAYTYGTNGIKVPKGKEYCVNLIDKEFILAQINVAKELEADAICINMHWGVEYKTSHNSEQENLAKWLIANGVDIIFGSHPHVLQKMQRLSVESETGNREGFVIYSQGNFISNMTKVNTKNTSVVNIRIKKSGETGKISIEDINYIPLYLYNKDFKDYKLLDVNEIIRSYENGESTWSKEMYDLAIEEKRRCDNVINFK